MTQGRTWLEIDISSAEQNSTIFVEVFNLSHIKRDYCEIETKLRQGINLIRNNFTPYIFKMKSDVK